MNERLKALLKAKEEARAALVAKSEKSEKVEELRSLGEAIAAANKEIEDIRSIISDAESSGQEVRSKEARKEAEKRSGGPAFNPVTGFTSNQEGRQADTSHMEAEKRGKELKEGRSITVASSNIVLPRQTGTTINPVFGQVSHILENVDVLSLVGGESYRQPYETGTADAEYTAEGTASTDTETGFAYADISKAKLTSYAEITEEVEKLPVADYEAAVVAGVERSVRKKLAKEIMIGDGATNHMTGIFSDKAEAIDASTDLSITGITNTTLDEIVFGYGGDEEVEGQAVLILNKKDLKAFAALRTTDGKKFHEIKMDPSNGSGTIDSIPFIINSACKSLAEAKTGEYCMAYGNLKNYRFTDFSQLTISKSTDYKFKEGMIAFRGVIFAGGNVVAKNGFLRVKKGAAETA